MVPNLLLKPHIPASLVLGLLAGLVLSGCGNSKRDAKVFGVGEKAQVDRATFSVVDTQTLPKLGDGADARVPANRFYLSQISVFNGGNAEYQVPTLILVDDTGQTYPELADGRGVTGWVGVSRKLNPGETLQGSVVFDAPVKHYKLRITDEFAEAPVYIDMPVSFLHEAPVLLPQAPPGAAGTVPGIPSK